MDFPTFPFPVLSSILSFHTSSFPYFYHPLRLCDFSFLSAILQSFHSYFTSYFLLYSFQLFLLLSFLPPSFVPYLLPLTCPLPFSSPPPPSSIFTFLFSFLASLSLCLSSIPSVFPAFFLVPSLQPLFFHFLFPSILLSFTFPSFLLSIFFPSSFLLFSALSSSYHYAKTLIIYAVLLYLCYKVPQVLLWEITHVHVWAEVDYVNAMTWMLKFTWQEHRAHM